jgi:signal transduction histidine kinase/integral membrane sensor domain MASE1
MWLPIGPVLRGSRRSNVNARVDQTLRTFIRFASTGIVIGAGYYVGATLGLMLRLPPETPSVLWPPNALLTATLLLSPPRLWPAYLLVALPVHMYLLSGTWPPSLALALFATNCSEAWLAASGVRLLGPSASLFNSLPGTSIFVAVVVVMAPLVSSFLDAAAVTWWLGEAYWTVWHNRLFTNMLSALTIVPLLVIAARGGVPSFFRAPLSRRFEGVILFALLTSVSVALFASYPHHQQHLLVRAAHRAWLAFVLPFILWAAVRFGAGGATLALLLTAVLAITTAAHRGGPFEAVPTRERVIALQLVFLSIGMPVLWLAALLADRERTQRLLGERLRFEELLSRLSQAFVQLPSHEMDAAFRVWLMRVSTFLEVECAFLFEFSDRLTMRDPTMVAAWAAAAPACPIEVAPTAIGDCRWMIDRIRRRMSVIVPSADALPPDAAEERALLHTKGFASGLALPLIAGERVIGALALACTTEKGWAEPTIGRARLIAEVLSNALSRKQAEEAIRATERMRAELAHVSRVATLGQLTVSLAHQINQPLTAIMSNAQAARRLLNGTPLDVDELRAILSDIVADDTRAADTIKQVRSLLAKAEPVLEPIDLNGLIQEVTGLVRTDALRRHVSLTLRMAPAPALVCGDRVQLQQAVLNVLLNAFEAVSDGRCDCRVHVAVDLPDARLVQVSISDSGPGFDNGTADKAFEPFYTTKANGLGMGLPIAREIIENHAGRMSAMGNEQGGATIQFTLPASRSPLP